MYKQTKWCIYIKYYAYNLCDHLLPNIFHSKHRTEGINIANFKVSLSGNPCFFPVFLIRSWAAQCSDIHEYKHHAEHGFGVEQMGGYSSPTAAIRPKGKQVKSPHCFW